HNVLTLAAVPGILAKGGAHWAELGDGASRGTQAYQLSGALRRPGLVETPFGITLGELLNGFGGGPREGRRLRAAQVGGPLGAWTPASLFGTRATWEGMAEAGGMLGHGGVVAVDDRTRIGDMARFAMRFCAAESCGKCAPCRIGSVRAVELIDGLLAGDATCRAPLDALCETMREASACGLGALAPLPVQSALRHFPEDFPPCAP
ncbi:MAG: SLBB domain-containing protein, partial [Alphaproteobacteria bacterium]|nr:SLBB domain-containing protein [Alphaproteobacteria bacterium]